ncbi:PREDICTED: PAXIP1-associated glutamate-rich protein 1-like isoform X2 [Priapulus caudatus]|uniref:PAXIP1-associated glutamate-rich protein 1-like isoform X2 n=1 Tax=Priapulus caudatus TaxID=37621 RepID=A0ABM1ERV4_PRICU|nr:PREDICTED: PAXIP1-associated glutamate-rich protein 1-like isoform X2 [Priapulus caudatus]
MNQDDDWSEDCSDDDMYKPDGSLTGDWHPDPKEMYGLYVRIESNPVLQLQWENPGRRPPTPEIDPNYCDTIRTEYENSNEEEIEEPTEFDFDDESGSDTSVVVAPKWIPDGARLSRRTPKRVANLQHVMKDMARHRRLQQQLLQNPEQTNECSAELS